MIRWPEVRLCGPDATYPPRMPTSELTLQAVADWVRTANAVTVLTGAGISTDSGIPDFRGPQGLWTQNPAAARMFSIDTYIADRSVRVESWRARVGNPAFSARPNRSHQALVDLERGGRLHAIVTQNIDELHQRAGSAPSRVLELHGSIWRAVCLQCGRRRPMADVLDRVEQGDEDPMCTDCGGLLKSDTISFGQPLDRDVLRAAVAAAEQCEVFLALGTSLQVQPASRLCDVAQESGARLVVLNAEPTPYDDRADAVLRQPLAEALPAIVPA